MPVASPRETAPSIAATLALIAFVDMAVNVLGFARSLRFVKWLSESGAAECRDAALTDETMQRVATAAAFYPRRALCLEQSMTLFVLLRRRGVPADLRVGIQTLPFSAHAWVEVDGKPINEKQGHIEQLATFQHVGV